ncbi:uncharacterized protein METZ01_LOCUS330723, partial [marine metagenome]
VRVTSNLAKSTSQSKIVSSAAARESFGQGEVFMIFVLTKILSGKQLLREDNLHAISRRLFGFGQSGLEIRGG